MRTTSSKSAGFNIKKDGFPNCKSCIPGTALGFQDTTDNVQLLAWSNTIYIVYSVDKSQYIIWFGYPCYAVCFIKVVFLKVVCVRLT